MCTYLGPGWAQTLHPLSLACSQAPQYSLFYACHKDAPAPGSYTVSQLVSTFLVFPKRTVAFYVMVTDIGRDIE